MYLDFFGFKEPPFQLSPDPRFFFFSKKHQEAFSHILYGLQERKGFIVITGEVGAGKTTLCRLLLSKLDPSVRTALLFNPQLTAIELLQSINQDFGLKGEGNSKKVLLDELNRFLLDLLAQGGNALLIIDEAQLLPIDCLEEIRLLSNLETDRAKLIQILLVGQPELNEKLAKRELRQLKQRISLSYEIAPLEREEVNAYVEARLQVAGGENKVRFTPKGIDRIYRFSKGFPRLINIVADQTLLAAYVAHTAYITDALVQTAIDELQKGEKNRSGSAPRRFLGMGGASWAKGAAAILFLSSIGWWGARQGLFDIQTGSQPVMVSASPENHSPKVIEASSPPSLSEKNDPVAPIQEPVSVPESGNTRAEKTPVSPPPSASSVPSFFDEAGIFRVERLSETEKGAFLTLLNLWAPLSSEENWQEWGMEAISGWMAERGLQSYAVPLNLNKISILDYPLLFSLPEAEGAHYQILAGIQGEEAVLLDPLSGKTKIALEKLSGAWKGNGVVLWSEIEGLHLPLHYGESDASVKKIQEVLKGEGLYLDRVDGRVGPRTREAIRSFQEKEGLKEDGLFGIETHLLLAKKIDPRIPSLRAPAKN